MPIPTQFDYDLAAIENMTSSVLMQVRTMQHAAPRDLPRMRERLRETLQELVTEVMKVARSE